MTHDHAKPNSAANAQSPHHQAHAQEQETSLEITIPQQAQHPPTPNLLLQKPAAIVQLQRTIGNRAVQRMLGRVNSPQHGVIQRKLTNTGGQDLPTPAGVISAEVGVNLKDIDLPNKQAKTKGSNGIIRAAGATATVTKDTLRDEERSDGIPAYITGMARAEQQVLNGISTDKYFDAGHLIADYLIGGKENSFVDFNLAPQNAQFNQQAYRTLEEKIHRWATWGNTVELTATLTYGTNYKVSIQQLIDHKVIKEGDLPQNTDKKKELDIPRRTPEKWSLKARITQYERPDDKDLQDKPKKDKKNKTPTDWPPLKKTEGQTRKAYKELKRGTNSTYVDLPNDEKLPETATIGQGYKFGMTASQHLSTKVKGALKGKEKTKEIQGTQWTPKGDEKLGKEEIMSLIGTAYPLVDTSQIINELGGINPMQLVAIDFEVGMLQLNELIQMYMEFSEEEKAPSNPQENAKYLKGTLSTLDEYKKMMSIRYQEYADKIKNEEEEAERFKALHNFLDVYKLLKIFERMESVFARQIIKLQDEKPILDTDNSVKKSKQEKTTTDQDNNKDMDDD